MWLSIVMPCLNEEGGIEKTIRSIPFKRLRRDGYKVEVLVVDGGSTDRSAIVARRMGARVIRSERGYGRQYLHGFMCAKGSIIATADSDNSYPVKSIPKLVKALRKGNLDFITTNRFGDLKTGSMSATNRFGNKVLTFFTNLLFSVRIKDSQSGMWVFRKECLKKLNLTSTGMPLSQELKIEAFRKLRAKEFDISYYKRVGSSKLKVIGDGLGNLFHLVKKRVSI